MANESSNPVETAEKAPMTAEELAAARAAERKAAIQAYHDAPTREAKGVVVKKYPFLAQIYSGANHS